MFQWLYGVGAAEVGYLLFGFNGNRFQSFDYITIQLLVDGFFDIQRLLDFRCIRVVNYGLLFFWSWNLHLWNFGCIRVVNCGLLLVFMSLILHLWNFTIFSSNCCWRASICWSFWLSVFLSSTIILYFCAISSYFYLNINSILFAIFGFYFCILSLFNYPFVCCSWCSVSYIQNKLLRFAFSATISMFPSPTFLLPICLFPAFGRKHWRVRTIHSIFRYFSAFPCWPKYRGSSLFYNRNPYEFPQPQFYQHSNRQDCRFVLPQYEPSALHHFEWLPLHQSLGRADTFH